MKLRYYVLVIFVALGATGLGVFSFAVHNYVIDFSRLARYDAGRASIVLDETGAELMRFELDRRDPVALSDIPLHVQQAFIAAEDRNFFNHYGISWFSIARSIIVNLYHMRKAQGASTITQQLVRLLFFDSKKTFTRKIKEQVCAILVERQFSKEQILQTYLNHVCFGNGIYGIEAAAQRFWGVAAKQLTIAQGATLAGIVRCPARYNPIINPLTALRLRNVIVRGMVDLGYITPTQCMLAQQEPLNLVAHKNGAIALHVREAIRLFVEERYGRHVLYTGGLTIQTTVHRSTQEAAYHAFVNHCQHLRNELHRSVDGALITVAVDSGAIRAMVGGCDFKESQFNRALQAKRQMGSIFKPLIYATALMYGRSFADTDIDEPSEFINGNVVWRPQNSTEEFEGEMTLARALSISNNIIAIKTLLRVGIPRVITLAKKCRLPGDLPEYPSLALGCVDVTLKDAVGAFNVFANDGVYVEPHLITWIKDEWGNKIYRYQPVRERVMDSSVAGRVDSVLAASFKRYLDRVQASDFVAAAIGKTGTTNDSRTCWFMGATPRLTTAIYIGRDDNQPLGHNIYPVWTAFPIWLGVHRAVDNHAGNFIVDPLLREMTIDGKTGRPASIGSPDAMTIYC